jgi:hypothetical protein
LLTTVIASVSEAIQGNEGRAGLLRRFAPRNDIDDDALPTAVILREGGVSSTPRAFGSITDASEYWIVGRSLSSGAHSRDPVADDDEHERSRDIICPSFANSFAPKRK